jgi:hypothetical protein
MEAKVCGCWLDAVIFEYHLRLLDSATVADEIGLVNVALYFRRHYFPEATVLEEMKPVYITAAK